jgi:pectin methylesterase-like acyl-CoA thioesterase
MNITNLFPVLAAAAALSAFAAPIGAQTVWHVAPGAPGSGNGSPGAPFASIQDAIDAAASSGDEVRIAPGTYLEHIDLLGKGLLVQAAAGPGTVGLQGDGAQSVVTLITVQPKGEVPMQIELTESRP